MHNVHKSCLLTFSAFGFGKERETFAILEKSIAELGVLIL